MFYKFAKAVVSLYVSILFRIEIIGAENIPSEGPVIICANHINAHDPLIINTKTKRRSFFLAKKELFENKFLRVLFLELGAFPVDRNSADMRAYKWALDMLSKNQVLGVFSQGTRKAAPGDAAKNGVALFALKSHALVVPCGVSGNYKLFSKVKVKFGEPISLSDYYESKPKTELLDTLTAQIMEKVFSLTE